MEFVGKALWASTFLLCVMWNLHIFMGINSQAFSHKFWCQSESTHPLLLPQLCGCWTRSLFKVLWLFWTFWAVEKGAIVLDHTKVHYATKRGGHCSQGESAWSFHCWSPCLKKYRANRGEMEGKKPSIWISLSSEHTFLAFWSLPFDKGQWATWITHPPPVSYCGGGGQLTPCIWKTHLCPLVFSFPPSVNL